MKLAIFFVALYVLNFIVKFCLRKVFKIQNEDFGDDEDIHYSDTHHNINLIFKIFVIIAILLLPYLTNKNLISPNLYVAGIVLICIIGLSIKIYYEWKYEYPSKNFILYIWNLLLVIIVGGAVIKFDLIHYIFGSTF